MGLKKIKRRLVLSLLINLILLLVVSSVGYYKRDSIVRVISTYFSNPVVMREGELKKMNSELYSSEIGTINKGVFDRKLKVLILGNSISLHGVSAAIGWNHISGMAASSIDKDYVHILLNRLSNDKKYQIEYVVVNISDFEKDFINFDYSRLDILLEFQPDITIFQIGENVSVNNLVNNPIKFTTSYLKLLEYIKSNNKIVCIPFWPKKDISRLITDIAIRSDSYLVDLSHLGSGIELLNFAKSENKYSDLGVAMHPSNYGMNSIAIALYSMINMIVE